MRLGLMRLRHTVVALLAIILIVAPFAVTFFLLWPRAMNGIIAAMAGPASPEVRATYLTGLLSGATTLGAATASVFVTLTGAVVAYLYLNRRQLLLNARQEAISRASFVTALEQSMMSLQSQHVAIIPGHEERFQYRNAMNEIPWKDDFKNADVPLLHTFINGSNYVLVRSDGTRIDSRVLHETMVWFRQLHRAMEFEILKPSDLTLLWRYILTFTMFRRFAFFREYFGAHEWQAAASICIAAYLELVRSGRPVPAYAAAHFDPEFLAMVKERAPEAVVSA